MSTKELTYKIGADYGDLRRQMVDANDLTRTQQRELDGLVRKQREHRAALNDLGVGMAGFGAAAVLGLGLAAKAAIDWESAFAGVRKTVDGSDAEIAALEGELRNLATTLPATHQEIAAVAEAAGQLGIKRQDIAQFTKTMIDLGETTNLTAEEAATSLAKFSNIMGVSASDVDRLGSALVALGNDGASTEKDIVDMGLRIAAAGNQIGLTAPQVLGIASALSSLGLEAEAGGSSFSTVMIKIASAVEDGGDALDGFAQVAGMSGDEFAQKWRNDAAGALTVFIAGLGRMQQAGGNVFGTLEQLGLSEIRVRDTLLRAAAAGDLFSNSLRTGSRAWAENQALAEEAAKRYATTEAQLQVTGNQIKDAMIDIGAALLPVVRGAVEGVRNLITWFDALPGPVKTAIVVVGALAGGITLLGGVALIAGTKIIRFRESMRTLAATGGAASGALGRFGLFMSGPWGAAIGLGVTLLSAFGMAAGGAEQDQRELAEAGKTVAQAIKEQNGVIDESVRQVAAKQAAEKGMLDSARQLGIDLPSVTDAILEQGNSYDELKARLQAIIDANTEVDTSTGTAVETLNDQGQAAQDLLNNVNELVGGKNKELATDRDVAAASKETSKANKDQAQSTQEIKNAAEEATKALDSMIEALDRINGVTLTARDAQRNYLESIQGVAESIREHGKTLNINTEDGRANQQALDDQAKSANDLAEAVAREAEANGGAVAGQAAMRASLQASRQDLFRSARQFGLSEDAAWAYVDSVLAIPPEAETGVSTPGSAAARAELRRVRDAVLNVPPNKDVNVGVLSAEAIKKLKDLGFTVRTLPDGSVVVRANTQGAKNALDTFIRNNSGRTVPVNVVTRVSGRANRAVHGYSGHMYYAHGGIYGGFVKSFAGGGTENHTPMVARAQPNTVRMWAEPETHGESYIPWALDRRTRATDVLAITADAFGFELVPKAQLATSYAGGGMTGYPGGYAPVAAQLYPSFDVRVYVGDREITDIVRTEITETNRSIYRAAAAGTGRAR